MESKKKLTIALFSVCAAVIVGLIVAVSVLAAGSQAINSAVNVKYTATGVVNGTATAEYKIGTATEFTPMHTTKGGTETTVRFNTSAADNNATGALVPDSDITLTETNNKVVFHYHFTNASTSAAYKALVAFTETTKANVTVGYGETEAAATATAPAEITVAANGTADYYVVVTVADLSSDATFAGSFAWTLTSAATGA